MALVSTAQLVCRFDPHRNPLISCLSELQALCKPFSTIGMFRPKKSVTPMSMRISMSLINAVRDDPVAQRRIGSHHPNIWDYDVIQSLSTPYGVISLISYLLLLQIKLSNMFNLCNFIPYYINLCLG